MEKVVAGGKGGEALGWLLGRGDVRSGGLLEKGLEARNVFGAGWCRHALKDDII